MSQELQDFIDKYEAKLAVMDAQHDVSCDPDCSCITPEQRQIIESEILARKEALALPPITKTDPTQLAITALDDLIH